MGEGVDWEIAGLAARQYAVVSWWQLRALGLGKDAIAHRAGSGRLHRVHEGVYAVMPAALLRAEGRWLAAVLACGANAALSHTSAAAFWALRPDTTGRPHVVVPSQAGRAQPAIVVHRCRSLAADEVVERDGIRVTTVARTLLDVARSRPRRVLERCVEGALIARVFDLTDVEALLARHAGRPGTARVAAAVDVARDEPPLLRSELERRFLALCADHGIPAPAANVPVGDYVVDFLWREERLAVETDGGRTHLTPVAFEDDRARDVALTIAGLRVVRFTHRQVRREPAAVAQRLRALLDSGRSAACVTGRRGSRRSP
jgi:Protein of unknown function (DUF559)